MIATSRMSAPTISVPCHEVETPVVPRPYEMTGMDVIEELRSTFGERIPGFLISGDTNAELLREIRAKGCTNRSNR
jgi:hypothetical protein